MDARIQILAYRVTPYTGNKPVCVWFEKGFRAPSVPFLFAHLDKLIDMIPENERWNIHYTLGNCLEERGRKDVYHDVIAFDIDHIDVSRIDEYSSLVASELKVDLGKTGIVFSGHGLHYIVQVPQYSSDAIDKNRTLYVALCIQLNAALKKAGLPGEFDNMPYSHAKTMRLPNTTNRKEGLPDVKCVLLNKNIELQSFDLRTALNLPDLDKRDQLSPDAMKAFGTPDNEGVLECEFIRWTADNQNEVSEPQWYAMLSIVSRLRDGKKLAHDFSRHHRGYEEATCDAKIEQAIHAAGPRTCSNIHSLWGRCDTCPHYQKTTSPICIRSANFIVTRDTGFRFMVVKDDKFVPGKVDIEGLAKYFGETHSYISMNDCKQTFTFNGKHWAAVSDVYLNSFVHKHVNPLPSSKDANEFRERIYSTNNVTADWFNESTEGKLNMRNGVLDFETKQLAPHSKDFGFRSVLDYDYDPEADAPRFKQFMEEISAKDKQIETVLMEFFGYSLSNMPPEVGEKAMILIGDGCNGKSVFLDTMRSVAGKDQYCSLSMKDILSDTNRYLMVGKLFNISEETPSKSMLDNSLFKNLVTGGESVVKQLYKQPFQMRNRTKLIMACNELPMALDTTEGMFRRLLIVPFKVSFENDRKDVLLREKLHAERAGILNLVIAYYLQFKKNRGFTQSTAVRVEIDAYRESTDTVLAWANQYIVEDAESECSLSILFSDYKYKTREQEKYVHNINVFGKRMRSIFSTQEFIRRVTAGGKHFFIKGVRLLDSGSLI